MEELNIIPMPKQVKKKNKRKPSEWENKKRERAQEILNTMDKIQTVLTASGHPRLLADLFTDLGLYSITLWTMSEEKKGGTT